ncbi:MAG: hypothetical protein ACP5I3_09240, partial [Thermoproteus sp.]
GRVEPIYRRCFAPPPKDAIASEPIQGIRGTQGYNGFPPTRPYSYYILHRGLGRQPSTPMVPHL